jgi:hypothetical protein
MKRAGVKDEKELAMAEEIFARKEEFIANVGFKVDLSRPHY